MGIWLLKTDSDFLAVPEHPLLLIRLRLFGVCGSGLLWVVQKVGLCVCMVLTPVVSLQMVSKSCLIRVEQFVVFFWWGCSLGR